VNSDQRPNPDSLLNIVNNDRSISSRGRLKVFFGASAGVGKTYAMLVEAHRKRAEGLDIVIAHD
jgi:two-component system, OmpR family, sensor histidine kinase KdpD